MEPRISIITLGVSCLEHAVCFYRDGLGFPTTFKEGDAIAFFDTAGTKLALFPAGDLAEDIRTENRPPERGFRGVTLAHNVASKELVDETLRLAEKAGGSIAKAAGDTSWGGYSGYFTDLDGFHWEIAWGPMFTFEESGHLVLPPSDKS